MKQQSVPWLVRVCYGVGAFGPAMAGSTLIFFQMLFMTDVAGLGAMLAGAVMMTGRVWDAVNDPFIGWLSDRTRTRWGRRIPWIVAGAVPLAAGFTLLLWTPDLGPSVDNQWQLFAYFCTAALILNIAYTAVSLPHQALLAELTHDYDERTKLAAFRQGAELAGSVGGLILAVVVFELLKAETPQTQFLIFGLVIAFVMLGSLGICLAGVWKPAVRLDVEREAREVGVPKLALRDQWRIAVGNRPFLIVCAIFLFSWLAMQFTATILPYYVTECLGLPDGQFRILALVVQGTALLVIPIWSVLCVRWGKKAVYYIGMGFWIAAQSCLFFLPAGGTVGVYVLGVIAGLGISVCYLVPTAMLPDVIELDELQTGQRREGVFYGFLVFMQKMALALGTFFVGWSLQAAGYISHQAGIPEQPQPESALFAIRLAIGPLPTIALLIGIFFAWKFPITKESHADVLRKLDERRKSAVAGNA